MSIHGVFAFRNLVKKYLNHPWTTNFEIRHKSGSSSINLIMASFHEAVSFIDLYLVIIFQELFMLYPNNHCIRMKRILLSKHCYVEYNLHLSKQLVLLFWLTLNQYGLVHVIPLQHCLQSKRGVKKRMNMIHCFLFHNCVK